MRKHRIRKLSPLWWVSRIGLLLLIIADTYIFAGLAGTLQ